MSTRDIRAMLRYFVIVAFLIHYAVAEEEITYVNNLVVGGGPSGLYTAWRLSSPDGRPNETTAVYEWSPVRIGGRIFTKTFPQGQHLELGGMRFTKEHIIVQQLLTRFDLQKNVTDFPMTDDRLYYLRGKHFYNDSIEDHGVPYDTHVPQYRKTPPSALFNMIKERVLDKKLLTTTDEWCDFFDTGVLPKNFNSSIFKPGDVVGNIGYWNLMLDQLGSEAFHYLGDAGGYTSNVINQNAAIGIFKNDEFSHPVDFKTLNNGYSSLFERLLEEIKKQKVPVWYGQRLTEFYWNNDTSKFHSTFEKYDANGISTGFKSYVISDTLLLCMPKHSIDLIYEGEVVGNWTGERRVLKNKKGRFYIESIIQQPAYKIGLLYKKQWWLNVPFPPNLKRHNFVSAKTGCFNYGPTITDLPLRQIYYMGDNSLGSESYYGILASYDDTEFPWFWRVLEQTPAENATKPTSEDFKPLLDGIPVPQTMLDVVRKQLSLVHFNSTEMLAPEPESGFFMNWELNPYGAGYHTWKSHYKIRDAQYYMTRPGEQFGVPIYVAGSAYSNTQGWVEGALDTAESILIDKFELPAITDFANYTLICRPSGK